MENGFRGAEFKFITHSRDEFLLNHFYCNHYKYWNYDNQLLLAINWHLTLIQMQSSLEACSSL